MAGQSELPRANLSSFIGCVFDVAPDDRSKLGDDSSMHYYVQEGLKRRREDFVTVARESEHHDWEICRCGFLLLLFLKLLPMSRVRGDEEKKKKEGRKEGRKEGEGRPPLLKTYPFKYSITISVKDARDTTWEERSISINQWPKRSGIRD